MIYRFNLRHFFRWWGLSNNDGGGGEGDEWYKQFDGTTGVPSGRYRFQLELADQLISYALEQAVKEVGGDRTKVPWAPKPGGLADARAGLSGVREALSAACAGESDMTACMPSELWVLDTSRHTSRRHA